MSTERHYLIEEKTHGMFAVRAGGSPGAQTGSSRHKAQRHGL